MEDAVVCIDEKTANKKIKQEQIKTQTTNVKRRKSGKSKLEEAELIR